MPLCFSHGLSYRAATADFAPGKEFDLQGFLDGAICVGANRVVVPPHRNASVQGHDTT